MVARAVLRLEECVRVTCLLREGKSVRAYVMSSDVSVHPDIRTRHTSRPATGLFLFFLFVLDFPFYYGSYLGAVFRLVFDWSSDH